MTCGIYKIENKINGKIYIGRSINIERRWSEHKRDSIANKDNKHLYFAFNKYGIDNFEFSIIEECLKEEIYDKEKLYIQKYDSYNKGYNETLGGEDGQPSSLLKYIDEIIKDLLEEKLQIYEIANKYNVTTALISMVNNGKRCFQDNIEYPIRKQTNDRNNNLCVDCGKKIDKGYIRCWECYKKYLNSKKQIPPKEDLINSILETNIEITGERFNVTGNCIKKWLKKYEEPYKIKDIYEKYAPEKLTKSKVSDYQYKAGYDESNKIKMIDDNKFIKIFNNINECCNYLKSIGLTNAENNDIKYAIRRVIKGKRNTYLGYCFEYITI